MCFQDCAYWESGGVIILSKKDNCVGTCECLDGFRGSDCSNPPNIEKKHLLPINCPLNCGKNGSCEMYSDKMFKLW